MKHILILMVFVFGCVSNRAYNSSTASLEFRLDNIQLELDTLKNNNIELMDELAFVQGIMNSVVEQIDMIKIDIEWMHIYYSPKTMEKYYVVKRGDTLWWIADSELGDPTKWYEIYDLNQNTILDPHWIYENQVLKIKE